MKQIYFILLALIISHQITSQTLENDRLALVDLYNSTNGSSWINKTGWIVPGTAGQSPCGWFGVTCTSGRVSAINLGNNNLEGYIPSSIGNLTNLSSLFLNANKLTGNIPNSIGSLTNLTLIYLSRNNLSGSVPPSIGNLTNLTTLSLSTNQLTGNIPFTIGNLTKLTRLYLRENYLEGSIPTSIGNLTNLVHLYLFSNRLTGSIPTEIGNLTKLIQLYLFYNELSGNIPTSIGNLTNMTWLYLNGNQLTGNIPSTIGNLRGMIECGLDSNQITGNIPSTISNLINLEYLNLSYNKLSGTFNLSGIPPAALVTIDNNEFLFDGIESNTFLLDTYSPQNNIPITNTEGVLSVNSGGTITNNTYKWYMNNLPTPIATNVGNPEYLPTITGTYYVEVTNNVATLLTLRSEKINYTLNLLKSIKTGNWEDSSTWNLNRVPSEMDKVIIDSNHTITIISDNAKAKNVEYKSNSFLIYSNPISKLKLGIF